MQNLIVAAVVLYACWYVLKRYVSHAVAARAAATAARLCDRLGWRSMAQRLQRATVTPEKSSACDSCSACAKAPGKVGKVGAVDSSVQKISVESLKRSLRH